MDIYFYILLRKYVDKYKQRLYLSADLEKT